MHEPKLTALIGHDWLLDLLDKTHTSSLDQKRRYVSDM